MSEDPDEIDRDKRWIVSEDVDLLFWCHVHLGLVPRFGPAGLLDARMPTGVDRIVAFNMGACFNDPSIFDGLPADVSQMCCTMSFVDGVDSMVFLSEDNRILAWLPIEFDSNIATGDVLVVECD